MPFRVNVSPPVLTINQGNTFMVTQQDGQTTIVLNNTRISVRNVAIVLSNTRILVSNVTIVLCTIVTLLSYVRIFLSQIRTALS